MMRSASRLALEVLQQQEQSAFDGQRSGGLSELANDLYGVADLLVSQPRLRRTLGDPSTSAERRAALAGQLLSGKIGQPSLELVQTAVSQRWSTPWDLTDSLEGAGDDALFAAAEQDGSISGVEDDLFRFERILGNEGELTGMLDEISVAPARRSGLVDSLVEGKVSPVTLALLRHAVVSQRKRTILLAIDGLLGKVAARQQRSVARVTSAVALTSAQQDRLAATLTTMYGRAISVRTVVDETVRGGLIVRVGDEVIDGSIATRLLTARNALAG